MIPIKRSHKSSVLILKLSLGCINLPLFTPAQAFAEEPPIVSLGQTTAICGDLLCYRTRQGPSGSPWQIHLWRLGPREAVHLFTKQITKPSQDPICMKTGVIVTDSSGVVSKFDLKGTMIYSEKPRGFEGVCRSGCRLNDRFIIMVKAHFEVPNEKPAHELLFVDVSSEHPTIKVRVKTEPVWRVIPVGEGLVAYNEQSAWKIDLPKEVK